MHLPETFTLRRRRWRIEYTARALEHEGMKCRGLCDPNTRTLQVWRRQRRLKLLATVIHEYLHAVESAYHLKIPHSLIYALEEPLARLVLLLIGDGAPAKAPDTQG